MDQDTDNVCFHLADEELVLCFLYPKLSNVPYDSTPVIDYPAFLNTDPGEIWNSFQKSQGKHLFFFTELTKGCIKGRGMNEVRQINHGPGRWHEQGKDHEFAVSLSGDTEIHAIRKRFTYKHPQSKEGGGWLMFQYSVPLCSDTVVLCRLTMNTTDDNTTTTTTSTITTSNSNNKGLKTTKRKRNTADDDSDYDATITKSRRFPLYQNEQKQIMDVNGTAQTICAADFSSHQQLMEPEPVIENQVKFDGREPFSHWLVQDFDNDPLAAANPIASSGNEIDSSLDGTSATYHDDPNLGSLDEQEPRATGSSNAYWLNSFPQMLLQENPICLIQENETEMIPNSFYMDYEIGAVVL